MKNLVKSSLKKLEKNSTSKEMTDDKEYICQKCRDVTYILDGDRAIPCTCKEVRKAERILLKSGISKEFANKTFENFDYSKNLQILNAYTMARSYVKDFPKIESTTNNSIIFMGSVGSGKSHISFSIANELMKNGVGVVYMAYRDSIMKFKQNIMDVDVYERMMNTYKNCKVLLIDDFLKGNITGSDINILFEIINHRYFNNLPMIISSEKNMDDLMKLDEAIGSRIFEMCKNYNIELKGNKLNYRIYG